MIECIDPEIGNMLARYEFDKLSPEEHNEFENHLLQCDFCFKQVFEFKSAISTIKTNIGTFRRAVENDKNLLEYIKDKFISLSPVKIKFAIPVLAVAATAILAVVIFWPYINPSKKTDSSILGKQDDQIIQLNQPNEMEYKASTDLYIDTTKQKFQKDTSRIKLESLVYQSMTVIKSNNGKNLIFTWDHIDNAKSYHIYLKSPFYEKEITPTDGIRNNYFIYLVDKLDREENLFWIISFELTNGKKFSVEKKLIFK